MKKGLLVFAVIFLLIFNTISVYAEEQINIDAQSYILADLKSGQILYEKDADKRIYPASTTKMLTAILGLEKGSLDQLMTASQAAVNDIGKDGMNIGIMAGEQLTMDDLLHALLIRSANETANIIAENICPTREEFVELMNQKAAELGATGTHFVNPCGAHDKDHYSTSRDLLKIAMYGMSIPKFKEIVGEKDFTIAPTNKHPEWPLITTTNVMMGWKSDYYTKVTGVKTGYTDPAGNNLVSSAVDSKGMELIAVINGVGPNTGTHAVFNFSRQLLEFGFKNYSIQNLVAPNKFIDKVLVSNAKDDTQVEIVTKDGLDSVLSNDTSKWKIETKININPSITAPINQGDVLGDIEYTNNGVSLGKVSLVASNPVEAKPEPKKIIEKTVSSNILTKVSIFAGCLLVGFLLLRFILRRISRKRRYRRSRF